MLVAHDCLKHDAPKQKPKHIEMLLSPIEECQRKTPPGASWKNQRNVKLRTQRKARGKLAFPHRARRAGFLERESNRDFLWASGVTARFCDQRFGVWHRAYPFARQEAAGVPYKISLYESPLEDKDRRPVVANVVPSQRA